MRTLFFCLEKPLTRAADDIIQDIGIFLSGCKAIIRFKILESFNVMEQTL